MKGHQSTGKTVDEAVEKALKALGIKRENALVEVLSEPGHGLFGFIGGRSARVLVKAQYRPEQYLEHFFSELLRIMNINGKITVREGVQDKDHNGEAILSVSINGPEAGLLIGRRGRTLNDLQYLANTILRRQFEDSQMRVIVDIERYRERREKLLTQLALRTAQKVIAAGREMALEPMSAHERRIIHLALKEQQGISTCSRGEEPYRRVIIAPC